MIRRYPSLQAFYEGDERRVRSVEVDFGVHWRSSQSWPTWRLSWVEDTGEIVAVKLTPPQIGNGRGGPVHVLATGVPEIEDAEELLSGWSDVCGRPRSLEWARDRCAARARAGV